MMYQISPVSPLTLHYKTIKWWNGKVVSNRVLDIVSYGLKRVYQFWQTLCMHIDP